MKINYDTETAGKGEEDRLILVKTEGSDIKNKEDFEPISIFKLGLLVNQLAVNEKKINSYVFEKGLPFYFERFVHRAIEHAKEGIDWAEPENEKEVRRTCIDFNLKWEKPKQKLLRRTQQKKLEEFEG